METISLKLPEDLLAASTEYAAALKLSRAAYIRQAVERRNKEMQSHLRAKRLSTVSRKVRQESMRVNAEFGAIERSPDG